MEQKLKNDPRYQNHESRPDLAGEHPQGDRLQVFAFVLFVIAILVDQFYLGWASWLRDLVPFGVRLTVSFIFIVFGGFLSLFGIHSVFSEYTKVPRMYTTGFFSRVRHPIYLGALIVYFGLLVFIMSPLAFLIFIVAILLYDWLARDEEARMLKIFGESYKIYMRQVPRWLPRIINISPKNKR
ncbi:MAG: isoprenylcysteine carboxylmethyltransferase family protein [Anaerolineaceae bacterium]|nr:isoprenylcysteine carboxylmethyltransferase family protein [Anaerolineaceae bacterium]